MLYNILKDQWQTIEIDRIRSITQEIEFSQMAELLYDRLKLLFVLYNILKDQWPTIEIDRIESI